ncbi:hypothetical protein ACFQ4K_05935 [Tistrella bauzanensis]
MLAIAARQHRLLVATDKDDRPLGFALTTIVDGHAHLAELDVAPPSGAGVSAAVLLPPWPPARLRPAMTG